MRKVLLCLFVLGFHSLFSIEPCCQLSFEGEKPSAQTPTVPVECVTDYMLQQFSSRKIPSLIFEFPEGTVLPVHLLLDGDLISLNGGERNNMTMTCLKKFYVYLNHSDQPLFSLDREKWRTPLEFFTGEFRAQIDAKNGFPELTFGLDMKLRNKP